MRAQAHGDWIDMRQVGEGAAPSGPIAEDDAPDCYEQDEA